MINTAKLVYSAYSAKFLNRLCFWVTERFLGHMDMEFHAFYLWIEHVQGKAQ